MHCVNIEVTNKHISFQLPHSAAANYCADAGFTMAVLDSAFEIEKEIVPLNLNGTQFDRL